MTLSIGAQLCQAGLLLLAGAALGLCFDVLAALRGRAPGLTAPLDALFVLAAALGLFGLGLRAAEGCLRLYMCAFAGLGLVLWERLAGASARRLAGRAAGRLARWLRVCLKPAVQGAKFVQMRASSLFSNLQKWFTIMGDRRKQKRRGARERTTAYEASQTKRAHSSGAAGPGGLRLREPLRDAEAAGRRRPHRGRA